MEINATLPREQNNVIQLRPANDDTQGEPVNQENLHKHRDRFREAETHHYEMRELAFRDEDYYHNFDNDQWTSAEKATLKYRGQPISTHNEIKRKANFLLGMEQRGRTDPKAFPRTPDAHEGMAKVATDILVYIDDKTKLDKSFSRGAKDLVISGIEAYEIISNNGENETINLPYAEFFFDPMSREEDFADAKYMGYARWFDEEDAKAMYPEGADYISAAHYEEAFADTYDDRPRYAILEGHRKRVRICVMYYRTAQGWFLTHFTGGGVLYEQPSPYNDEDGKPHCAIMAQSLYVDRENRRYGMIRDMIGPQDEINHNRSKIWALANNRRTWGVKGTIDDVDEMKSELAAIDGHVETSAPLGTTWGFVDNHAEIAELAKLLANAQNTLANMGPNSGLRGRGVENQSGRAIMAQQDAGLTEENSIFDGHQDLKLRVYKANFARAKQFWDEPKFIRVVTPEGQEGEQFVALNQPIQNEFGQQLINPRTGQPAIKNSLGDMDVEIILDAVPDTVNSQIEQFDILSKLVQSGVPIPPTALIMASQLRDKDKILKEMQTGGIPPEQQQAQQQQAAMQQQIQMKALELEMTKLQADIKEVLSSAYLKDAQAKKAAAEVPLIAAKTQGEVQDARIKPAEAAHRMASADDTRSRPNER